MISTATYVPVPLTLLGIAFIKQLTSSNTILIPFFVTLAIAAASIFEIKLFLSLHQRQNSSITHDLEKMFAGVMTILIPEIAYATAYFISFDHILAILTMSGTAFAELAIALSLLKRS